jgi:hypothetical protein
VASWTEAIPCECLELLNVLPDLHQADISRITFPALQEIEKRILNRDFEIQCLVHKLLTLALPGLVRPGYLP